MKHIILLFLCLASFLCVAQADATVTKAYRVDSIVGGGLNRFFVTKVTVELPDGTVRVTEEKLRFDNIDSVDAFVTRYRANLVSQKTKAETFVTEKTSEITALDNMPQQRGGIQIMLAPPIPGLTPTVTPLPEKPQEKKKTKKKKRQ